MNEADLDDVIAEDIGERLPPGRLVTFGEGCIVLHASDRGRFESAPNADITVGGAELNTGAAYACLDLETEWVSVVANSPFGLRIMRTARSANVGIANVQMSDGRTGLKFVESGSEPRNKRVVVDAGNSVFAQHRGGGYAWDQILDGAGAFYFSDAALGVSAAVRQDVIDAMTTANNRGLIVACSLNYRPDVWSEAEARRAYSGVVRHTDVLFTDRSTLETFFGIDGSYDASMRLAIEKLGVAAIAMTRERTRANGRITLEGMAMGKNGLMTSSAEHTVEVVDSAGAKDAFAAGFLAGYLDDPGAISRAVSLGAAMSALVQTMPGEMLIAARDEIEELASAS